MKNQYFADERDFLKYDLWIEVAEHLGRSTSLTFIPMLTEPDGTRQGGKTKYELGRRREKLYVFLRHCLDAKSRSILWLREFFQPWTERRYYPYKDGTSGDTDYFSSHQREGYFDGVQADLLANSAILIDPDTGLETKGRFWRKHPERYVLYSDVVRIAKQSSGDVAIILVQFPQRNAKRRRDDLRYRADRLREKLAEVRPSGWNVHWVAPALSDGKVGDLAFFILTPNLKNGESIERMLARYSETHRLVWSDPHNQNIYCC
ncbi:MAG TPA: hypothetical protein VGW33_00415 [Terriglobia bacterium]|nr:hypothetical protein [Terriglobia bacterium]